MSDEATKVENLPEIPMHRAGPDNDYPLPEPTVEDDAVVEVAGRSFRISVLADQGNGRGFRVEIQHSNGEWLSAFETHGGVTLHRTQPREPDDSPEFIVRGPGEPL